MVRKLLMAMTMLALVAGCSKPQPPEKERPVEPQATQLRDAINAPLDKAKNVQKELLEANERERAAIDAQEGVDGT
ncbi:hypothetical protein [Lysobacter auxotrophicus]|uniref:Lipoprotein n=1 Tax=Lysobacter auxotrophicus TaxID=2992573 RepID=A0ABN6UFL8_9GAMM|nr:hypothetical protein [Lysobacter auxotrophicus]BDU15124.1 hypothetical protein LA521A_03250 [Lysobacter auxotrophicus]